MQFTALPQNEQELLERCHRIAGKTVAELAYPHHKIPSSLIHAKGFVGQLIEWHLGAQSSNSPVPDFLNLGIELKTLPLNENGLPQESTFVCTAPNSLELEWRNSRVYQKLKRVLWVPIESSASIPIADRRVGNAILWSPDPSTEQTLQEDWRDLMEMMSLGRINELSAHFGTYLQIRPKAAHSRILQSTINENGEEIFTGPKGFYLRTTLTKKILEENYCHS